MPLLDHFHPPISSDHSWEAFHANWATKLADALMAILPPDFVAEEERHIGANFEIDISTYQRHSLAPPAPRNGLAAGPQTLATWAPPMPSYFLPAVFPDSFEVRVLSTLSGRTLVGAIELVSPGNKDRPEERRAFATKCASYLHQGVSLIVIDIVTNRRANLHNEIMRLMAVDPQFELHDGRLYAVAYRPVCRDERPEFDVWTATFELGDSLPTMPLRLSGDRFVPVDFEATYQEACQRRRLA